jgi:hypothetical protein
MKLQGFIGPTYNLKSKSADAQRCVNLYPEMIESGTGKEGQQYYYRSAPGLKKILEVGDGPIRLVHIDPVGTILVVSGLKVYRINKNGETYSSTEIGTLNDQLARDPVKVATIANGANLTTVFVDGTSENYAYQNTTALAGTFSTFTSLGYPPVENATHVEYLDNFLIYINPLENKFYVSDWASLTVDPLSFASSEASPDKIVSMIVNNRELWIFNERTTEIYYNSGNGDFPFERLQGGVIETGCAAAYSPAKIDGVIFWLGQDDSGAGTIYAANGTTPQRISTHAIEQKISLFANYENAKGFTYQKDGHSFYQINFDETSFVYDLQTKMWHERCHSATDGTLERHRANNCVYSIFYKFHILGDYESNKLYLLDENYYYYDDSAIQRIRISPHLSNSLNYVFYSSFQLDMEVGVGLDGGVFGSNPVALLSYSNDGGFSWSSELPVEIGKIGEYKKRVIWRKLGKARDRVFKIKITDPVIVNILSAEIEVS